MQFFFLAAGLLAAAAAVLWYTQAFGRGGRAAADAGETEEKAPEPDPEGIEALGAAAVSGAVGAVRGRRTAAEPGPGGGKSGTSRPAPHKIGSGWHSSPRRWEYFPQKRTGTAARGGKRDVFVNIPTKQCAKVLCGQTILWNVPLTGENKFANI